MTDPNDLIRRKDAVHIASMNRVARKGASVVDTINAIPAAPEVLTLVEALRDTTEALKQFVDTNAEFRKPYEHPLSAFDRGLAALAAWEASRA